MTETQIPLNSIQQYKSRRLAVTEALRTAIILGELEEGRLYSAPALAESFGVSATPVREAMMDLASDGLVTSVKNKGFRVTEMTTEDLRATTAIRQLLEAPAMRAVAGRIPEEDYPELYEHADRLATAGEERDLSTYLTLDRTFHAALIRYTGNAKLEALCTRLRSQNRLRALRALADTGQLAESSKEHIRLLDHLRAGEADAAYNLIMQHLGHASQLWFKGSEENGEVTPLLIQDLEKGEH